jgi:hypothetical protein
MYELTTPAQVASHLDRPGYRAANIVTCTLGG